MKYEVVIIFEFKKLTQFSYLSFKVNKPQLRLRRQYPSSSLISPKVSASKEQLKPPKLSGYRIIILIVTTIPVVSQCSSRGSVECRYQYNAQTHLRYQITLAMNGSKVAKVI